jgi:ABC-2 type transport system permease protein
MLGGYLVNGYRTVVPAFDAVAGLTWWSWGAGHLPLAGPLDWPGIAVTGAVALVLLVVGVEAFARRDVGVTLRIPSPGLPSWLLGVREPVGRAFGDLLPGATWWAAGLAVYGVAMAAASGALLDALANAGGLAEVFRTLIPGIDITTAAGFLQLAFADLGFILVGLAAATLVAGPWGDESSGRLEILLTTPLARRRWALAGGLSVWIALAEITMVLAVAIGAGVASIGQEPATVMAGTLVLGLYGIALTGIGMAAGGIGGSSVAAPAVAVVAVGTFLLDTLAPVLRLPGWISDLALTTHLGQPMIGRWDAAGLTACVVIAVMGLAVGAWGMGRRDVEG